MDGKILDQELSSEPLGTDLIISNIENGKTVNLSRVTMTKLIRSIHTDTRGYVYGGQLLSWIDIAASISARRHTDTSCVTRSVDAVHFLSPIPSGLILVLRAAVNRSWNTSLEVGVRVETEDPFSGLRNFCCHAYLTFVALKPNNKNQTMKVCSIIPNSLSEQRRFDEAEIRRQNRLKLDNNNNNLIKTMLESMSNYDPLSIPPIPTYKTMSQTYGELVELVLPQHANTLSITFGGQIMEWMEACAIICALRLARTKLITASVDMLQFHKPTYVGNVITIKGMVTKSFHSSMEVYVQVAAEDILTKKISFTNDGFITVVAIDDSNLPKIIKRIQPLTEVEQLIQNQATERRSIRINQRNFIKNHSVTLPST